MRGHHSPFGYAVLILVVVVYIHLIVEVVALVAGAGLLLGLLLSPAPRKLVAWARSCRDRRSMVDAGTGEKPYQLALVASAAKGYAKAHSDPRADPSVAVAALMSAEREARAAGIPYQQVEEMTRKALEHPGHWAR